jgi:hypothetical protein
MHGTLQELFAMPSTLPTITGEHAPKTERKLFSLLELHPQMVMDGELLGKVFEADPVTPAGNTREQCPHCAGQSLQLVLREGRVIRPFLFCPQCTRCFDAVYPDGRSALMLWGLSID